MTIPVNSGDLGANINLQAMRDGTSDALRNISTGMVSSGHTWLIPIASLLVLWFLGAYVFKSVRV